MPYYIEVEAIQVQENLTLVPQAQGLMEDARAEFQQWAETNGLELDFSPRHGEE